MFVFFFLKATIYDNENKGMFMDITMQFYNTPIAENVSFHLFFFLFNIGNFLSEKQSDSKSFVLRSCCWARPSGKDDLEDDSYCVLGGDDKLIHICSLKRCKVERILEGHSASIIGLFPHPSSFQFLFSISEDQTIRLWHLPLKKCIAIWNFEHPSSLVTYFPKDN